MSIIDRNDMLELTRRMTLSRNCFSRIAGAYFDEDGYVDGTFNTSFLKLSNTEKENKIALAKAVLFSKTNEELQEYAFTKETEKPGSVWQLLNGLLGCELKNDALLDVFYEALGETLTPKRPFTAMFFFGNYDIPRKGTDGVSQWESEEVYTFLVCAICPLQKDYEADAPFCGFLYPAFRDRSADPHRIDVFGSLTDSFTSLAHCKEELLPFLLPVRK